jgi:hypothetical protein
LVTFALFETTPPPAGASTATASATPAPVLSQYENASSSVRRDAGLSVALPNGKDLWIFGDTTIYNNGGSGPMAIKGFISGGPSAEGAFAAGQIPTSLLEVPSPGSALNWSATNPPALFMPTPTNVYLPDGSGGLCSPSPGQYSARWPTGAAVVPNSSDVLVTYSEICVTGASFQGEGWGFMEYNWSTNGLDVAPDDVVPPSASGSAIDPTRALGSPVISNGQVSLFSSVCTNLFVACSAGQAYAATLSSDVATLSNPASYSVTPISTDSSSTWTPINATVASYADTPFRMIETTDIAGDYKVLTATTAAGPWHLETTGLAQRCQGVPSGFCYALVGHPELSTSSQLVISYFDPGAGPMDSSGPIGHLVGIGASYTVPVPTAPQQLSAVASSTSPSPAVQLTWSPPANASSGLTYNIYRSTTAGQEQSNSAAPIATGVTGTSYTDSGLVNGTTYDYVVTATNSLGFEGLASNEASATASNCTSYTSSASGTHSVCGAIRVKYLALGGPTGFLGYPTTDETGTPDGVGRFNNFSNSGSIYWSPSTGAWSIHGAIRAKYLKLGGPTSFLGYPITDETGTPDGIGRFNHFSSNDGWGASIYWTRATGAWSVHGAIRAKWASMGWERSCLGYPVSDEFGVPGGRRSNFQHGSITWTPSTGANASCQEAAARR